MAAQPEGGFRDRLVPTPPPWKLRGNKDPPKVTGFTKMDFPLFRAASEIWALEGKVLGVSLCKKTDLLAPPPGELLALRTAELWSLAEGTPSQTEIVQ